MERAESAHPRMSSKSVKVMESLPFSEKLCFRLIFSDSFKDSLCRMATFGVQFLFERNRLKSYLLLHLQHEVDNSIFSLENIAENRFVHIHFCVQRSW